MAEQILPSNFSTPIQGYGFTLTDDGGLALPEGKSSVTLTGFEPEFVPNGILLYAITGEVQGDGSLPAACYASYDADSIVKYTDTLSGHDPTLMLVDLYLSTAIKTLIIFVF